MGCYKLTYDYQPTLFLQEQGEKIYTPDWRVTVNACSKLGGEGDKALNSDGRVFNPFKYIPKEIPVGLRATLTSGNIAWIARKPVKGETAFTEPVNSRDKKTDLTVYYDPELLNLPEANSYSVIGHEWIHIMQYRSGAYADWIDTYNGNGAAKNIAETNAWGWNNEVYPNVMMPNQRDTPYQIFYGYLTGVNAVSGWSYTSGKYW